MNLEEAKTKVRALFVGGKSRQETCDEISTWSLNGSSESVFSYFETLYNREVESDKYTDATNAELFARLYGEELRYDHKRGRWLHYTRTYWREDADGQITRMAIQAVRHLYRDALHIEDPEKRKKASTWALISESKSRLDACVTIAESLQPIASDGEGFDSKPWLLCAANGVINLRTGQLRSGQPEDLITQHTPIEYNPESECPRWLQFLNEIFNGDTQLVDWIWRSLGYSISGQNTEQCFWILYGAGANGKSKFLGILHYILGDFALDAPFSTFEFQKYQTGASNDEAALERKRFVIASEASASSRLNEQRLKALTGDDTITARFLYHEHFTFKPVCKIWLGVNHRPRVTDDSYGCWRRVRLVPFLRQFMGEDDDKQLGEKLKAEAPGILNWLVKGCIEWQKRGLSPIPDAVSGATTEYQQESDPLLDFLNSKCKAKDGSSIKAAELYKNYIAWTDEQGYQNDDKFSSTAFGRRMAGKFKKQHTRAGWYYLGLCPSDGLCDESQASNQKILELPEKPTCIGDFTENVSQPVTRLHNPSPGYPDYPLKPCSICGGDYSLRENRSGPIEWVCNTCHPKIDTK